MMATMTLRLAESFRRGARLVRMLCVLSLALASVLHVVGDFRSAHPNLGQTVVSTAQDGQGTDGSLDRRSLS